MTPPDLDYSFLSQLPDAINGINMFPLNPIVLRLKQDQVLLAYPFRYLSAVNGKATEIVVNYENRQNFTGCDETSQVNPTCGLKHDRGISIPYSEGFCCFCPEMPVNEKQIRGGQDCSLDVGDPADIEKQKYKASAHCLEFNDIWYSVSALSEPVIIHETYMQVYNQRHFVNGSSAWVALTHDEDFELGAQNPYQYDENKTILISYLTSAPNDRFATIPVDERRLLTPQPMPAVELLKLPTPVKRGASDYLLIPKIQINPYGRECDVSGVSYEAFAKQNDRCNAVKDTCLKNQPLDFWEMDDEKRKAGAKGSYLLENFGVPYKEPIIVDPETKEHWLAMEYHEQQLTVLSVEINADEIVIMTEGKRAQISKITSSNTKKDIDIHVTVLNSGLMPAKFQVQVVKCAFQVPDSNAESIVIPPQMAQDVIISTKPSTVTLDEKFSCNVEVSNDLYGIVAKRNVAINPVDRCICNFHCKCSCLNDDLECELMSEEDYHAAGFQGSLPVLTAKPPYKPWILKHPYMAVLAVVLLLLLIGFIKGICGLARLGNFGDYGLEKYLYRPKAIKNYFDFGLKKFEVIYDEDGYPIHPHTKKRVKVICEEMLFALNLCFCFFWPCTKTRDVIAKKVAERKKKRGAWGDEYSSKRPFKKGDKISAYDDTHPKTGRAGRGQAKEIRKHSSTEYQPTAGKEGFMRYQKPRTSISDSVLEAQLTGPIADPLNKELERWQKGKTRIQAVTK